VKQARRPVSVPSTDASRDVGAAGSGQALYPQPPRAKIERMDQAAILRDYTELRRKSVPLNTRLAKTLDKEDIDAAASALGMLHGKQIELQTHDEINVIMDYAIHSLFRDGRNAVDRLLEADAYPEGSPELRLLRAMREARFTLFEVTATIPGFGVHGLDGPAKTPIVIVDLGFSKTARPGMALATRICSPGEGWWMTTGAALPLNEKALDRIVSRFEDYERRFGVEPSKPARERIVLRACIASGASQQIRYADIRETASFQRPAAPATAPARSAPKPGRNDPCPCGSGRKYKKCCGS
jgi:hypothetical protein